MNRSLQLNYILDYLEYNIEQRILLELLVRRIKSCHKSKFIKLQKIIKEITEDSENLAEEIYKYNDTQIEKNNAEIDKANQTTKQKFLIPKCKHSIDMETIKNYFVLIVSDYFSFNLFNKKVEDIAFTEYFTINWGRLSRGKFKDEYIIDLIEGFKLKVNNKLKDKKSFYCKELTYFPFKILYLYMEKAETCNDLLKVLSDYKNIKADFKRSSNQTSKDASLITKINRINKFIASFSVTGQHNIFATPPEFNAELKFTEQGEIRDSISIRFQTKTSLTPEETGLLMSEFHRYIQSDDQSKYFESSPYFVNLMLEIFSQWRINTKSFFSGRFPIEKMIKQIYIYDKINVATKGKVNKENIYLSIREALDKEYNINIYTTKSSKSSEQSNYSDIIRKDFKSIEGCIESNNIEDKQSLLSVLKKQRAKYLTHPTPNLIKRDLYIPDAKDTFKGIDRAFFILPQWTV